jgi:mannitol/fructose-specific phosphotransferase system IIA component (Ntr-type)
MIQSSSDKIFSFDIIDSSLIALNKRQSFKLMAHTIAGRIGINEKILLDRLCDQEKSNPITMERGIAIKHMAMDGLLSPFHMLVRFKNAVDMDAPDKQPIEFMLVLLTPNRDGAAHLQSLSRLTRFLRDDAVFQKLRIAPDEKSLRAVFETPVLKKLAA